MSSAWLLPALGFVIFQGALGITTKLAMRDTAWRQLLLVTAVVYAAFGLGLVAIGENVSLGNGTAWAVLSGLLGTTALILFFVALERGDASRVVPITAGYPLVTAILAALALSEEISLLRGLGTILVVIGIVWLGRE